MTPFDRVRQAWATADRATELNRTVEQLAVEGVPRTALDDALGLLMDHVRAEEGGEDQEEIVAAVGDRLHGWCHASRVIASSKPVASEPPLSAVDPTPHPYSPTLAK